MQHYLFTFQIKKFNLMIKKKNPSATLDSTHSTARALLTWHDQQLLVADVG